MLNYSRNGKRICQQWLLVFFFPLNSCTSVKFLLHLKSRQKKLCRCCRSIERETCFMKMKIILETCLVYNKERKKIFYCVVITCRIMMMMMSSTTVAAAFKNTKYNKDTYMPQALVLCHWCMGATTGNFSEVRMAVDRIICLLKCS